MGVRGLFSFIKDNTAYDIIDLVEVARSKEIEIIVDTHSFSRCIVEISIKKIAKDYNNDFLLLPVGEYDIMGEIYYDFHMAFKEVGIKLVWVVDGPKGVDEKCTEQKITTWKKRDEISINKKDGIFEACSQMKRLEQLNDCSPIIDLESGLEQLKKAGADIIHLLQGEADDFIAHTYKQRNAFAILTNDTDYVLFNDCNVLFEKMFTLFYENDALKLPFIDNSNVGKVFKRPSSFRCVLSNSSHVCNKLKLKSHDQLIATSILKGNDFTAHHIQKLAHLVGITRYETQFPFIKRVAEYITSHNINTRNITQIPQIRGYLLAHPDLEDSINYSRDFYSLRRVSGNLSNSLSVYDTVNNHRCLTDFLAEKISTGTMNRYCYAIHHGSYFEYICTEQLPEDCASIMNILEDIRRRIYPFLLNINRTSVVEWRSRIGKFVDVKVKHEAIQANKIRGDPDGLKIFEGIWSHEESENLNYVETFGDKKKALVLYLLRYLYKRNQNKNLRITMTEFKALFVTVFYQYAICRGDELGMIISPDAFRRMNICPSARCLTIATWFMNMYYTAKYICGGALDLTESFPFPVEIMNGSTLFAFYEIKDVKGNRVNHLNLETRGSLSTVEAEILQKFNKEYHTITQI